MFRKEHELTEKSDIEAIIRNATVCRIGLCDNNLPYIVPMSFGYQDNTIYVHGALKGQKIDIIRKNNNVCFEFDINTDLVTSEKGCDWGMKYRSVIGFGKAAFLEDSEQKRKALDIIMAQYTDRPFQYSERAVKATAVIKIAISTMTGKQAGY
jgi:nitroimidazol reductase NimA-like FMN-containing flavoprotein (pyridoxamine 5'-phosphate oxidase superfamily)